MGFGVDPQVRLVGPVRERELPFRRELLVRLQPGSVPAAELLVAYRRFTADWLAVARALDVDVRTLVPVEPERLARAATACAEATVYLGEDRIDEAVARVVAALADHPWDDAAGTMLSSIVQLIEDEPAPERAEIETRSFAVGLSSRELLDEPALFDAYLTEFCEADDVTLVVHGSEQELAEAVDVLVPKLEQIGERAPDVVAVASPTGPAGERALAGRLDAALSQQIRRGPFRRLPQVDADRIAELRQLADREPATRVLFATESFHPGPCAEAAEIGAALQQLGCTVQVATAGLVERTELEHHGIEIVELDPSRAGAELARFAADGNADVVLGIGLPFSWPVLATLELREAGTHRVVFPIVDEPTRAALLGQPEFADRYRDLLATADLVLVESQAGAGAGLLRDLELTGTTATRAGEVAALTLGAEAPERAAA
jgi:hypothetical protein